jgi:SPP1 gp7 family putative phage head morphogenesis protein
MSLAARFTMADLEALIGEGLDATSEADEHQFSQPAEIVGPGGILEYFDIPTGDAFDIAPDDAIALFKVKGLKPAFSYADMLGKAHMQSFTVAKMMDVDMLGQVRTSLEAAMANGTPFKEWSDGLVPMLQGSGWWGRKEMVDPLTGQTIIAQLGSPHRLETIFRTNMQTAYAQQQWEMIDSQKDIAPFLMYDAVDDFRTRPAHKARDNTILPVDHPWWDRNTPPLGYNCRCGVIQLTKDELDALGKLPNTKPPALGEYEWKNPRTGHTHTFPDGIDPGFDYNAGKLGMQQKLEKILAEKIQILPPDMQRAVNKALANGAKDVDAAIVQAANVKKAKEAGKAALERAQAIAAEKAKEAAKQALATQELKSIAAGPDTGANKWLKKAMESLSKISGWSNGTPADQLGAVKGKAVILAEKQKLASNLSGYKKKVLAGKTPSPAHKAAFESLSDADQDAFLKKIEAEKAAIAAKKAKEEAEALAAQVKADTEKVVQAQAKVVAGSAPDPNDLVLVARKTKGANAGGIYQDTTTGTRWMVKHMASEDVARNEVLTGKLYELAGMDVPELHFGNMAGKPSVFSRMVDGIREVGPSDMAKAAGTFDGFGVDAWLANWDVVGLDFDNLVLHGSKALRIDVGGGLRYRATGGLKGQAFGDTVGELDTLRNPGNNPKSAQVFGGMSQAQIEASVRRVLALDDNDIRAVVEAYGPIDLAERKMLADRLIARRADLARRFPDAADQGKPAPVSGAGARVTAEEQALVEAARVNGFGFKTDKGDIEDQMVVVSLYEDAAGAGMTRGWTKLRPDAAKGLYEQIAKNAGVAPQVELGDARDSILQAIKGINLRAGKSAIYEQKDADRLVDALAKSDKAIAGLKKALAEASPKNLVQLQQQLDIFEDWAGKLRAAQPIVKVGNSAQQIAGKFPNDIVPDEIAYALAKQTQQQGLAWKKGGAQMVMDTADITKARARANGGKQVVPGVREHYTAELTGGGKVTFIPDVDRNEAYAMRGVLIVDVPGMDTGASGRVFMTLDDLGLDGARAGSLDRDNLYLNAYARLILAKRPQQWSEFLDIDNAKTGQGAVDAKLAYIKKTTGVDVANSDGWAKREGVYQAFGHGRAYQFRPDLDTQEFRDFAQGHLVYHNPMSLLKYSGSKGVWERLRPVIEGGGHMASLADRVRRGVSLNGSSVGSDFNTGGASYFFTRIKARSPGLSAGYYWKPDVLKRMDAITYGGDQFGRVTPGSEATRYGQSVSDFKTMAGRNSDETIFKNGLSAFDDLEMVVFKTKKEMDEAIAGMKSMGYSMWPDGRKLTDVFKWEGGV